MKRLTAILIILLLITGCTAPAMNAKKPTDSPRTVSEPTRTPAPAYTQTPPPDPTAAPTPPPVELDGRSYPFDTLTLDLSDTNASFIEIQAALKGLPNLTEVDLGQLPLTVFEAAELKADCPKADFIWSFMLYQRELSTLDTEVDLTGCRIGDEEELRLALTLFVSNPTVDLSFCSLSYDRLALLRENTDSAMVVWTIKFKRWRLRTDAVAFSTWQKDPPDVPLTSEDVDGIRYCTELVALDLGHNEIRDISFLEPLKNLKILILADNLIRDISVLRGLDKLMYVELFLNYIHDLSPLANKDTLLDLNLCYNRFDSVDISPILTCKKLERIWICANDLPEEQIQAIREAFPNGEFDFTSVSCTNLGWRDHPRFKALKRMLKENIILEPFN